jgi:hypothetical protein
MLFLSQTLITLHVADTNVYVMTSMTRPWYAAHQPWVERCRPVHAAAGLRLHALGQGAPLACQDAGQAVTGPRTCVAQLGSSQPGTGRLGGGKQHGGPCGSIRCEQVQQRVHVQRKQVVAMYRLSAGSTLQQHKPGGGCWSITAVSWSYA